MGIFDDMEYACNAYAHGWRYAQLAERVKECERREKERKELLKDLQTFIDNADSHIGCPNGTLGTAYLVQWMGGQGWDCD
jgi:hypothetical protein